MDMDVNLRDDTVRLDGLQKQLPRETAQETAVFPVISGETAVFTAVPQDTVLERAVSQDTAAFTPVGGEQPSDGDAMPEAEEGAEPYSDEWEPEYEQPIGSYTPPIAFKPSRLRQLRAQLVAGPERRYFELTELGFGKLQATILLTFLIFLLAGATTLLYELGYVGPQRLKLLVFVQLFSLLLAGFLGSYRLMEGLQDLLRLRFSLNTLLCISFAVCGLDGILCLGSQRISCCALFCLQMLMAQIAAHQKRSTQLLQTDTLRKASDVQSVVRCEGYMEEKPGFLTGPDRVADFMDSCDAPAGPERLLATCGLVAFIASLGLGVYGYLRGGLSVGVQVMAGALLLSMPATAFLSYCTPARILGKRLYKMGTVLCNWRGCKAAAGEAVFPLESEDIFPQGQTKFNGVKFFGNSDPDMVVAYAASLVEADGSGLTPLFIKLMQARACRRRPVADLHAYEGGVTALVDGDPVSLGDLDFMRRMDVKIPGDTRIPHAVYISINGVISGVFAITYNCSKSSAAGLRTLCGDTTLEPVLVSNDFALTEELLCKKFSGDMERMLRPERDMRLGMAQVAAPEDAALVALITRGGLSQRAFAVTGGRALHKVARTSALIHILGGGLGLAAALVLTWVGGIHVLTPGNLLIYWLLWMIPGWLSTQSIRFL